MKELIQELKNEIVSALNLEDVRPEDIDPSAPLFGDSGLGLDSIDALELIVLMEKKYGIKLDNPAQGREIFTSLDTMAGYITAHRKK